TPPKSVRRRSIPRQGGQVGAVNGRQKAGANHAPMTNPKIAPWQAVFRTIVESGYTMKNSKLIVSAAVAVSAILGIGAASAADLPMKAWPPVAPAFSWSGLYVGVNAGAGVLLDQGYQNVFIADRHGVGGLAGGQIGFNYQMGMLVVGIEGEGSWSGMKVTQDQFFGNSFFSTASIKNKWDYDVAGRFGIAVD